jgi:hypothetical protein
MRNGGSYGETQGTGEVMTGNRGGTMSSTVTPGPLARIGRRIVAIIADCNYVQDRMTSLQHTPERF